MTNPKTNCPRRCGVDVTEHHSTDLLTGDQCDTDPGRELAQIIAWNQRHNLNAVDGLTVQRILAARDADHAAAMVEHLPLWARVSGEIQFQGMAPQNYTGTITTTFTDGDAELTAVNIRTTQPLTTIAGRKTRNIVLRTPQGFAGLRRES